MPDFEAFYFSLQSTMAHHSSRSLWTAKLEGRPVPHKPNLSALETPQRPLFSGFILGADPSLRGTGLALIHAHKGQFQLQKYLRIQPGAAAPMHACIGQIAQTLDGFLRQHNVDHLALEQTIYVQNQRVAQILGAVKGALIGIAGLHHKPAFEYPPLRIKQVVVGFGRASKEQVQRTALQLLGLPALELSLDESDALAAALCHGLTYRGEAENRP